MLLKAAEVGEADQIQCSAAETLRRRWMPVESSKKSDPRYLTQIPLGSRGGNRAPKLEPGSEAGQASYSGQSKVNAAAKKCVRTPASVSAR